MPLEGVESLLEKSLLRQEEGPRSEPRFVMLETIHEYAREKLKESGKAEEIRRAHAYYFLTLAEQELKGRTSWSEWRGWRPSATTLGPRSATRNRKPSNWLV